LIFLSSWDPKTPKTIKNSRADFYPKTLLSPYLEESKKLTLRFKTIGPGNVSN
jgi:hypothetical protein